MRDLAAAALGALVAIALVVWAYPAPPALWLRMDFNGAPFEDFIGPYFEAARALPGVDVPPPGYHYPAFLALALKPLTWLGPAAASWAWLAVQVAAGLLLVGLPLRMAPARCASEAFLWGALAASAHPLLHGIYWGQVSGPLAALLLLGVHLGAAGRPRLEGALIGLATAVKLVPGLFLLGPALRGERRALVAGVVATAALLLVPSLLLGPAGTWTFHREVAARLVELGQRAADPALGGGSQDLAAASARWIPIEGSFALGRIVGLALALKVVTRVARCDDPGLRFAHLALLAPLLVAPTWPHGLVALVPGAWFVWRRGQGDARWLAAAALLVLGMGAHAALGDATRHASLGVGALGALLMCAAVLRARMTES